ncbi:MAG: alpha/beta fold hydrolase [Candidatus Heimdallarchaeota archaeon]
MEYETEELTDKARATISGDFIELTDGIVHYELAGPLDGKNVVLVHGFSSPMSPVWDNNFPYLSRKFRVLRYDLFGRGYSDKPDTQYDVSLYIRQLEELLTRLELIKKRINLVGLSMGGIICVVFAVSHHEMVEKLSLIDPAGCETTAELIPSEDIWKTWDHEDLIEGQREDFYDTDQQVIEEYLKKYQEQTRFNGFLRAIKSTIEHIPFTKFGADYRKVEKFNIPAQLIWGKEDRTIPFSSSSAVIRAIPHIQFYPIEGAGHIPNYTHSRQVNQLLGDFLS